MHKSTGFAATSIVLAMVLSNLAIATQEPEDADEAAMAASQTVEVDTPEFAKVVEEVSIPEASDIREEMDQSGIKVYVNNPPSRYELLKKLRSEVFVIDARSEADAEVIAFKKLKQMAQELGADGLIEVKRSIVKDSVAQLERPVVTGSMLGLDMDSTAIPVDELMLNSYSLDKGTLSNRVIDQTFDRSELSQKAVRFTGKAIKLQE
jgi:hypothetical protein